MNHTNNTKIGILSGKGRLPVVLAHECQRLGVPFFMVGFEGITPKEQFTGLPHSLSRLGAIGNTLKLLKRQECTHVIMAGSIDRPTFSQLVPDVKGAMVLAKLLRKGRLGDDGLLRELANVVEEDGFTVIGAHELAPHLLSHNELYSRYKPSKAALNDLRDGVTILTHMESHDIGQAIVLQEGLVLGIEAIEGTAELIRRCGGYIRKGEKPVLVKRKKANQDMRFDLPTVGVDTIEQLADNGFAGLFIEAGGSLVLDREAMVEKADERHVFVMGFGHE